MLRTRWINVEIKLYQRCFNVVSTLLQRRTPTLYQRYATLKIWRRILFHFQRRINVISTLIHNVETTLIQRWNVGWDYYICLHNKYISIRVFLFFLLCLQTLWEISCTIVSPVQLFENLRFFYCHRVCFPTLALTAISPPSCDRNQFLYYFVYSILVRTEIVSAVTI